MRHPLCKLCAHLYAGQRDPSRVRRQGSETSTTTRNQVNVATEGARWAQVEEEGVEAVCRLGRGDMRQTLNILQSTFMSAGRVSADAAYLCTGNPQPAQIEAMATWLLNEPMADAYAQLRAMQVSAHNACLLCAMCAVRRICGPSLSW